MKSVLANNEEKQATAYERLASKLLLYTLAIILISCIPIYGAMYFFHLVDLYTWLYLIVCVCILVPAAFFIFKKTNHLSIGKYLLTPLSFIACTCVIWVLPSQASWSAFLIYITLSVVYLNMRVSIVATIYAVVLEVILLVFDPLVTALPVLDMIVLFAVTTMVGSAGVAICILGQKMMSNLHQQKEQIDNLLQEVERSAQELTQFGGQLQRNAEDTDRIGKELTTGFNEIAKGIDSQAGSIGEINTSMQNSETFIRNIGNTANDMTELAERTASLTRSGNEQVIRLREGVLEVGQTIDNTHAAMNTLRNYAQEISSVSQAIENIARQTNMLSFNAGIEASRAGEHGRGFAVIATEIRDLASEAQQSTVLITDILHRIHDQTEVVSGRIQQGKEAIDVIQLSAEQTESSFGDIMTEANTVSDRSVEIGSMLKELIEGIRHSVLETGTISAVTEQSSASIEQMTSSLQEQSTRVSRIANSIDELKKLIDILNHSLDQNNALVKSDEVVTEKVS